MIKSAETWILLKYMLLGEKSQAEKETILYDSTYVMGFLGISVSKESACSAGDTGLIPGSRRTPGEGYATHSSILAWRIPWIEEPGGLRSIGLQDLDVTW